MPFSRRLFALQGQLLAAAVFVSALPIAYELSGGPGRRVLITLFARSLAFLVGTFEFSAKACADKEIQHKPMIVKTGALRMRSIVIYVNVYVKIAEEGIIKYFTKILDINRFFVIIDQLNFLNVIM
jgi:hypothetical protein